VLPTPRGLSSSRRFYVLVGRVVCFPRIGFRYFRFPERLRSSGRLVDGFHSDAEQVGCALTSGDGGELGYGVGALVSGVALDGVGLPVGFFDLPVCFPDSFEGGV
jgi:hypothetical protein